MTFTEIIDMAEEHRVRYNKLSQFTNHEYWKGRRDEAGYFRDILVSMREEIELPQSRLEILQHDTYNRIDFIDKRIKSYEHWRTKRLDTLQNYYD